MSCGHEWKPPRVFHTIDREAGILTVACPHCREADTYEVEVPDLKIPRTFGRREGP